MEPIPTWEPNPRDISNSPFEEKARENGEGIALRSDWVMPLQAASSVQARAAITQDGGELRHG
jgi:hypothetical protein